MDKKYNNFNKLLKYITYYSYVLCSDFIHVRVHISLKILFLRCQWNTHARGKKRNFLVLLIVGFSFDAVLRVKEFTVERASCYLVPNSLLKMGIPKGISDHNQCGIV